MIELLLLNDLWRYLRNLSESEYEEFTNRYDMEKLIDRSQELTDDFLSDYVIDKSE